MAAQTGEAQQRNPFPNYMQMRSRIPMPVWHAARAVFWVFAVFLCVLLVAQPEDGLKIWWRFLIPIVPLLWFVAPGLWRNTCPLATSNQAPRLFGFTRGLTLPDWWRRYAPIAGMLLLIAAVATRRTLFNTSGPATAALIGGSIVLAFVGGFVFKGKSGWCSSLCPLLPVQRMYGQTPFATVPNTHCQPCVGCTKNCYDFNPRVAYLADLNEDDPHYVTVRKFFVALFPGLIVAYFTIPDGLQTLDFYGRFALYLAISLGAFFALDAVIRVRTNVLTAFFGASAISVYYWFSAPVLSKTLFDDPNQQAFDWALRGVVWALALVWLVRTWQKERVFLEVATAPAAPKLGGGALAAARKAQSEQPEVTFEPSGLRLVVKPGATLLDMAEHGEQQIEAGCRMGVCGADPVCVREGMENLSPISADEKATLERLGYADNTRMACCARIEGPVTIALTPERAGDGQTKRVEFDYDESVKRVVVIGNGIAGVTAADHVRRRHPDCQIDIAAVEPYPLYNRMGIARLVYGRTAMVGLQLLPDSWYEENRVNCWLNTRATRIDREKREVELGTGETLPYDRLIIATGSRSFVPPIEGYGLPGTFVLRDASDALKIRTFAQEHRARTAIVAGGGLLGLEAAYALHKLGLSVSVLERGTGLLSRQLDETGAEMLRSYLEGLGLHIEIAAETAAARGNGRLTEVELRDGRRLPADVLLVAAGISPEVDLADNAGLSVEKGIVVDDGLRTSDPTVFAVGDVAEHHGRIYGLWPAAVDQAEIAAENALGGDRAYAGTVPVTMLKVVGIDLASMGRFQGREGDEEIALSEPEEHRYRKLVIEDGRVVGAILIGHQTLSPSVTAAVKETREVGDVLEQLRAGDWDVLAGEAVTA
jgi:NADPH-dependent 2,4-dienoyl-CoA reductase/sulfur reductase-like enzyme/ferredoxin